MEVAVVSNHNVKNPKKGEKHMPTAILSMIEDEVMVSATCEDCDGSTCDCNDGSECMCDSEG
ncbi:MAG TPA: hypothetical protein VF837_03970 [Patescibacteria group bacterium]